MIDPANLPKEQLNRLIQERLNGPLLHPSHINRLIIDIEHCHDETHAYERVAVIAKRGRKCNV